MSRVQDFIDVLSDPNGPSLEGHDRNDDMLRTFIAHIFFADDELAPAELAAFGRLCPGKRDVESYIQMLRERPLDLDGLAAAFATVDERAQLYQLAEKAVFGDDKVVHGEVDLLEQVMRHLGFEVD